MSYGERLSQAIEIAKSSRAAVAKAIGISEQAVGQAIRGDTKSHTAENQARICKLLGVDYYWLATGEGKPRPISDWPFSSFLPSQYSRLDPLITAEVEQRLLGAIIMMERGLGNGTDG